MPTTLTPTHLAFVVLVGVILSLDRSEWFIAITFGVLIDIDHVFGLQRYVEANGLSALLAASWDDGSGATWKSLMHYPIGAIIVAPLALGWRLFLPLLFWASHIGLDYLQIATLAYSALVESVVLAGIIGGILFVSHRNWRSSSASGDVLGYFSQLLTGVRKKVAGALTDSR